MHYLHLKNIVRNTFEKHKVKFKNNRKDKFSFLSLQFYNSCLIKLFLISEVIQTYICKTLTFMEHTKTNIAKNVQLRFLFQICFFIKIFSYKKQKLYEA